MEDNEWCAVTCGESGNGLKNAIFSPGSFTVEGDRLKLEGSGEKN